MQRLRRWTSDSCLELLWNVLQLHCKHHLRRASQVVTIKYILYCLDFVDNYHFFRGYFQPVPNPSQGWFLCYLFVYSQLLVDIFIAVHPNHQVGKNQEIYQVLIILVIGRVLSMLQETLQQSCSSVLLSQLFWLPHTNTWEVCKGSQVLAGTPGQTILR